jgi:hypothetical protein
MKKQHEKILIAALAGLVIAGAAAFAIQPGLASGPHFSIAAQADEPRIFDALDLEPVKTATRLPIDEIRWGNTPG